MKHIPLINEALLVRGLAKGNLLAFNTLYGHYSGRLYRFSYGYLKSDVESEELVQEVFIKIWETRSKLKSYFSFKSYIFTIAINIIRKHFKSKAYISRYFESEVYNDFDIQTSEKITYDSLLQYIKNLVETMPERRREIFQKSRFEGQSIKEIAEELNISHKTIENQLTEALRFIRKNLIKENAPFLLFCMLFIF